MDNSPFEGGVALQWRGELTLRSPQFILGLQWRGESYEGRQGCHEDQNTFSGRRRQFRGLRRALRRLGQCITILSTSNSSLGVVRNELLAWLNGPQCAVG
ncbi:hypothetical protein QVD99_003370 [Batrachochytrium dendrobatidis]|nr:hypothetical protein QVD99_003370 [Batrachochytrium dendrobatidis]